jgi:acyl carrier protein
MNEPGLEGALAAHVARREEALARVRRVLIENLKVAVPADAIDLDAPLFGTGIGLDSVDAVELVVAIESEFGLRIPEGSAGPWAFRTVHSLVEFVLEPPPGAQVGGAG